MSRPKNDDVELLDFSSRLNSAITKSPKIPEAGKGKQTELARLLGVSQEAVRRWINGLSRPRASVIEKLAEILEVDPAWLALGVTTSGTKRKPSLNKSMEGAVYYVFSILALFNRRPAFTNHGGADLAVIVDNELRYFAVAPAILSEKQEYVAELTSELADDVEAFIVVPDQSKGTVYVVHLTHNKILAHSDDRGGFRIIKLRLDGKTCKLGKEKLSLVDLRNLA